MDIKKKLKRFLLVISMWIAIFTGGLLVLSPLLAPYFSYQLTKEYSVFNLSKQEVKNNMKSPATFNYAEAQLITPIDIYLATARSYLFGNNSNVSNHQSPDIKVIGNIAIPSVNINIPIVKGTSQYAISIGAGTMKSNEKMGEKNYALASHNMNDDIVLFSPLRHIKKGDYIYTSDGTFIYYYRTIRKYYVAPDKISVIEDHPGVTEITLVTCSMDGHTRLIVTGHYIGKQSILQAPKSVISAFDIPSKTLK